MLSSNTTHTTYHAPVFEPTVDELAVLKKLELGEKISLEDAVHAHVSKRLLERGMVVEREGYMAITEQGLQQIKRNDA
ncbi:hypothetical protein HS961_17835 [Comamonas piscis]|uniref:Uncharacterized protein n=1 Tax=Comamonas piscis TaxID=1562974 RepID=A0A7G5EKL9_9BURK|nr:hypothetical protein [Comamonas piscis]QMV74544.1 hypothetical protein HS961_17835 [Comamonas piscis]WSO33002.1 hypothetical protein VUJ63_17890 [Comamonas piscis]